jgi:hypothetical protein
MTYSRDATTFSEINDQPVNTWSLDWQNECEARTVLKMSKDEREKFFNTVRLRSRSAAFLI